VRFTEGSEGQPIFGRVIDRLVEVIPGATRETIEGAAHRRVGGFRRAETTFQPASAN
jgi:hypothetical protein